MTKSELYSTWILCRTLQGSADLVGLLVVSVSVSLVAFPQTSEADSTLKPKSWLLLAFQDCIIQAASSQRSFRSNLELFFSPQGAAVVLPQLSEHCRVPGLRGQQRSAEVLLLCESLLRCRLSSYHQVLTCPLPYSGFTAAAASCPWFRRNVQVVSQRGPSPGGHVCPSGAETSPCPSRQLWTSIPLR